MVTNERRQTLIPAHELNDFSKRAKARRRAYERLGIWDLELLLKIDIKTIYRYVQPGLIP